MAVEALDLQSEEEGISAAFLRNHHGKICIAFADPAYVRSEAIVFKAENRAVYAVLHENMFLISHLSDAMGQALASNEQALLTAIRNDGTVYEQLVPVRAESNTGNILNSV